MTNIIPFPNTPKCWCGRPVTTVEYDQCDIHLTPPKLGKTPLYRAAQNARR